MRDIQYVARGIPNRAYPKWLVLNFSWKLLSGVIGSSQNEKRFRYMNEEYDRRMLSKIDKVNNGIFRAALQFFRLERGKGKTAKDISTFFQLTKLDSKFEEFWKSSKNKFRGKVENAAREFQDALTAYELPE